jgi:hypothetical protein
MYRQILVTNSAYFEAIFQPQHSGFIEKENKTLILQVCCTYLFSAYILKKNIHVSYRILKQNL